jgi:hypothetical protein
MTQRHPTWSTSFRDRAFLTGTSPLATYLLHLISIKKSNLCLSADVSTTSELLTLAEEVGDSICLLKTHADIINDFSDRTVRGLRDIAKRKRFLVFEDRKFGDIGSTFKLASFFIIPLHCLCPYVPIRHNTQHLRPAISLEPALTPTTTKAPCRSSTHPAHYR